MNRHDELIEELRRLQENPSPEAAQDLVANWPTDYRNLSEED